MMPMSKVNAVSTSSRTLTEVLRGPSPVAGSTSPLVTTTLPPCSVTDLVSMTPAAPTATAPPATRTIGTSSPAVGAGGVAAASSGDRTATAPSTSIPVWLPPLPRRTCHSPSVSASIARNSPVTSQEERSSAILRRTRKRLIPSLGLLAGGSDPAELAARRFSAAVRMSISP